jgi:hypothetical protein
LKCKEALETYQRARRFVVESGFAHEISWQKAVQQEPFSESDLLREAAWVVLCGGFRESVVRKIFGYLSLCFCDWESAHAIVQSGDRCVATALLKFRNERKLRAIHAIAERVVEAGFDSFRAAIQADPRTLATLPHIGPVTWAHAAKNLGFDVAKEDRHVLRIAYAFGFSSATSLCSFIGSQTGERLACVDIVLWRYAVQRRRTASSRGQLRQRGSLDRAHAQEHLTSNV